MSKLEFLNNAYQFGLIEKKDYINGLKEVKREMNQWFSSDREYNTLQEINRILAGFT